LDFFSQLYAVILKMLAFVIIIDIFFSYSVTEEVTGISEKEKAEASKTPQLSPSSKEPQVTTYSKRSTCQKRWGIINSG